MIVPEWLFQQTSQIVQEGINGKGEPFTKTLSTSKCRLDLGDKLIKRADGSTVRGKGRGLFPKDAIIESGNKIICDDIKYEVDSVVGVPTLFGISHKEVVLI